MQKSLAVVLGIFLSTVALAKPVEVYEACSPVSRGEQEVVFYGYDFAAAIAKEDIRDLLAHDVASDCVKGLSDRSGTLKFSTVCFFNDRVEIDWYDERVAVIYRCAQ